MKIRLFGLSVAAFLWFGVLASLAQESTPSDTRSVWDGVYTSEQSQRGQSAYADTCQSCHGDTLKGAGEAPALSGPAFLNNWSGLPLGDLYERIRRSMPQDNPARATRLQKIDILAYILSFNKFPAGKTELPHQPELLKQIRFEATRSDANK